jgi:hypothetical protein
VVTGCCVPPAYRKENSGSGARTAWRAGVDPLRAGARGGRGRGLHAHLPEEIQVKRAALASEERRITNDIDFIGAGKGTRALGEALRAAEQKAAALLSDLKAYEASANSLFKAPPAEWIAERLSAVKPLLEVEPTPSALLLRRVLGPARLVPVVPDIGRPYYQTETALQVLELIEAPEGGSNWLRWWRRWESNPRPETLSRRRLRR